MVFTRFDHGFNEIQPHRYLPFLLAKGTGTSTSVMDIPTFFAWEVTECFGVNVTIVITWLVGLFKRRMAVAGKWLVVSHEFGQEENDLMRRR